MSKYRIERDDIIVILFNYSHVLFTSLKFVNKKKIVCDQTPFIYLLIPDMTT